MAVPPARNLGPVPQFGERAPQQYDKIIAQPSRNAFGERGGQRHYEEGTWRDAAINSAFYGGVAAADSGEDHERYRSVVAGQAEGRKPIAATNPPPSWDAVDNATKGGMVRGSSHDGEGRYESIIAPENGGRARRSISAIWE